MKIIPAFWSNRPVIELIQELIAEGYRPVWRNINGVPALVGLPQEESE